MRNPILIPGAEDSAMTEVALALAMAFFSILVLTLVSIGGGAGGSRSFQAIHLAQTAPETSGTVSRTTDDVIVIFDGARFLDTDLNTVEPAKVPSASEHRIVLAVDPAVRLADVMAARSRFASSNLVITNLDSRWRAALEAARKAGHD